MGWPLPLHKQTELPPRARRIRDEAVDRLSQPGTTSACAENTGSDQVGAGFDRNYLRVRGEYLSDLIGPLLDLELPPRARRIPRQAARYRGYSGTTSACAENTKFGRPFA